MPNWPHGEGPREMESSSVIGLWNRIVNDWCRAQDNYGMPHVVEMSDNCIFCGKPHPVQENNLNAYRGN